MSYVLGLDLSIRAPAAVALPLNWRPGSWRQVRTWALSTTPPSSSTDTLGRLRRYDEVSMWALGIITELGRANVRKVIAEDYAFTRNITSTTPLRESGGIVKYRLWRQFGIVVDTVPSTKARKLFLGKLPRADVKLVVQDKLFNVCGAPKTWTEDVCDAFVVAQYALSECGGKVLTLHAA